MIDAALFSALWVSLAAAVLTGAVGSALGAASYRPEVALAGLGTLCVYCVDWVRGAEGDHATSPLRAAFVARHRRALLALACAAGLGASVCALVIGPWGIGLGASAGTLGLAHRRLKHVAFVKGLYVVMAWLLVVVGLPARTTPDRTLVPWAAALLTPALLANVLAASLRDGEAGAARLGPRRALRSARLLALLGVAAAALAPPHLRPLGAVALATAAALLAFRPGERYGLGVIDGALVAGGLLAWLA